MGKLKVWAATGITALVAGYGNADAGAVAETRCGDTLNHSKLVELKNERGEWNWTDGAAYPNAGTDYVIRHFTRTPDGARSIVFGGKSLTLAEGGSLNFKCTGAVTYDFPRDGFVFAGGLLAHLAHGVRVAFAGRFTVTAPAERPGVIRPAPDGRTRTALETALAIEGPFVSAPGAGLRVTGDRSRKSADFENWGIVELNGDVSGYRGALDVRDYGVVIFNRAASLPGTLTLGPNGYLGVTNLQERTFGPIACDGGGAWVGFDPDSGRTSCLTLPSFRRTPGKSFGLVLAGAKAIRTNAVGRVFGPLLKVPAASGLTADAVALTVVGYDFARVPRFRLVARDEGGMRGFYAEGLALTEEERARLPLHIWMDEPPDQTWTVEGQYPEVPGTRHATVFEGDEANGAYNHHAKIAFWGGRFHAAWSNQRYDEDGPGQRVLYASSEDGVRWSRAREVVPSLSPEAPWSKAPGVFCQASGFAEWEGRLFAIGGCTEIVLWRNMDKTKSSPVHTRECGWPEYRSRGWVAREVKADGSFGTLFSRLCGVRPEILLREIPPQSEVEPRFRNPPAGFAWDPKDAFRQLPERRLCEQVAWKTPKGEIVGLFRDDSRSGYKWMSFSKDGFTWTKPRVTDMHDAPSLTRPLVLEDGTVLLFGNHRCLARNVPGYGWRDRDPLMVSVSRDGLHFSGTRAVREGYYRFRVQPGPRARGGSAQYPDAIVRDGMVHVIYSLGKESIATTVFPLANLLDGSAPAAEGR